MRAYITEDYDQEKISGIPTFLGMREQIVVYWEQNLCFSSLRRLKETRPFFLPCKKWPGNEAKVDDATDA